MPKSISAIVIVIILIVILIGLIRQISGALNSGKRLDIAVEEVSRLQEENRNLKRELEKTGKEDFIEEIARDKLNMARQEETVVIINQKLIDKIVNSQKKEEEITLTNWQRWLRLFIK